MRGIASCLATFCLYWTTATAGKFDTGLFENYDDTRAIFEQELILIEKLKDVRNKLSEQKETLQKQLDVLKLRGDADATAEDYMLFPTNAFNALTRSYIVGGGLKTVQDQQVNIKKLIQETEGLDEKFPSYEVDYEGALKGIVLLQDTYQLNVSQLADGVISFGGNTFSSDGTGLNTEDLTNFGIFSSKFNWMDTAAVFLREAMVRGKTEKFDDPVKGKQILDHLDYAVKKIHNAHNSVLKARKTNLHEDHKTFPYMLDEELKRNKKQPKFVKKLPAYWRDPEERANYQSGEILDEADRRVCREDLIGRNVTNQVPSKCHLLHHADPYLRLGPLTVEYLLADPFRMIFHDILSEEEIQFMIEYSKPRLSRTRVVDKSNVDIKKHDMTGRKVKVVGKTVQCWLVDKVYNQDYFIGKNEEDEPFVIAPEDPYSHTVALPIMHKLAKKIEIYTRLHVEPRFSATEFQVTNYGLSGLVESHVDPHGYIQGMDVTYERKSLYATGDMLATFMAWLGDVDSGGYTAFDYVHYEQSVHPRRGSAAFWIDLDKRGFKERRSSHAGCPILKGSKWILNKWIYYFNQWDEWKCGLGPFDEFKPYSQVY